MCPRDNRVTSNRLSNNLGSQGAESLLCLGKVVGTHGLKGELKVLAQGDSLELLPSGAEVFLFRGNSFLKKIRIISVRPHKRVILLMFEGVELVDAAQELTGCQICVDRAALPPLENGTYYWQDVIGLDVITVEGRILGLVAGILETRSNDVYLVKNGTKELLVPAIASVIECIDLEKRIIRVNLPEGLEECDL